MARLPVGSIGRVLTLRSTDEEVLQVVHERRMNDMVGKCVVLTQDEYTMLLEAARGV